MTLRYACNDSMFGNSNKDMPIDVKTEKYNDTLISIVDISSVPTDTGYLIAFEINHNLSEEDIRHGIIEMVNTSLTTNS